MKIDFDKARDEARYARVAIPRFVKGVAETGNAVQQLLSRFLVIQATYRPESHAVEYLLCSPIFDPLNGHLAPEVEYRVVPDGLEGWALKLECEL